MWLQRTDGELIKAIAKGEKEAFHSLYDRYKSEVLGLATRLMGDRAKGEDVFQTTWFKITQKAQSFAETGSARAWILTIARNEALSELRRNKRWKDDSDLDEIPDEKAIQADLTAEFWEQLQLDQLTNAMNELPEKQRVATILFYFERQSLNEVAANMNLQVSAIKALLFRARGALKRKLEASL